MKLTEFIEQLQAIRAKHGDMDVKQSDWNEQWTPDALVVDGDISVISIGGETFVLLGEHDYAVEYVIDLNP